MTKIMAFVFCFAVGQLCAMEYDIMESDARRSASETTVDASRNEGGEFTLYMD